MKRPRRRHNDGRKKKKKNEDMLTDLPDSVLLHIMSFLETKGAVRTSVLSKRWKDLWKCVPTLTLNSSDPYFGFKKNLKGFRRFVSWILSNRDASIALHSVDFEREGLVEPYLLKRIVRYAVSHNVQQLRVYVNGDIQHFHSSFFSCHTLTSLDLCIGERTYDQIALFPNNLNLPALTSLSLRQFAFLVGDDGRAEPFSTFNRLNSLIIDSCIVPYARRLCISSVTLANLTIQSQFQLGNYSEIELSTPALTSLSLHDFVFPVCVEPFSTFNRLDSSIMDSCIVIVEQKLYISSVTLANITIQTEFRPVKYDEIELSTPSLRSFAFTGLPFPKLSGNHLCSIKHVNIDAYTNMNFAKVDLTVIPSVLLSWLIELTHIRSLIVSSTILQVLSFVPDLLKLKIPSLCNLKSLQIKMKHVSLQLSYVLIDMKLAQQPTMSQEEVAKLQEAFKRGPLSIPDGIVDVLLQNSPSAKVHIIN